jgi:hypothetical protein
MLFSKDRCLFSKLTTKECQEIIHCRGNHLNEYTVGQIEEMIPPEKINEAIIPTLFVLSSEKDLIDTSITLEEYTNWKKS